MELWLIVAIVAIVLIGAGVWVFAQRRRSERLAERFGPEYGRALEEAGDRKAAERDLAEREKRVSKLDIRRLDPQERDRFGEAWTNVQAQFVDDPSSAIGQADALVQRVMDARGYPVADFEQRASDISVDHPRVVEEYRAAHAIAERHAARGVATEELRQAMIHYRALFEDLLEVEERDEAEAHP